MQRQQLYRMESAREGLQLPGSGENGEMMEVDGQSTLDSQTGEHETVQEVASMAAAGRDDDEVETQEVESGVGDEEQDNARQRSPEDFTLERVSLDPDFAHQPDQHHQFLHPAAGISPHPSQTQQPHPRLHPSASATWLRDSTITLETQASDLPTHPLSPTFGRKEAFVPTSPTATAHPAHDHATAPPLTALPFVPGPMHRSQTPPRTRLPRGMPPLSRSADEAERGGSAHGPRPGGLTSRFSPDSDELRDGIGRVWGAVARALGRSGGGRRSSAGATGKAEGGFGGLLRLSGVRESRAADWMVWRCGRGARSPL